eukprot:1739273-Pleurochrysis_carterae.AAC.2
MTRGAEGVRGLGRAWRQAVKDGTRRQTMRDSAWRPLVRLHLSRPVQSPQRSTLLFNWPALFSYAALGDPVLQRSLVAFLFNARSARHTLK